MALSIETLAVAKKYTDDSIAGGGALKGKNCVITSIASITGGHRVTFQWTLDNGTVQTDTMDVMDGADGQDGEDGKGIQSVSVNENNHLIITYSDGTTTDAGQIEIHSAVDSVNGQTGTVSLDAEDVGALPDDTPIPSKTSDLTNNSGFITKVVNDLVNYYLKSETYSKTEVDDIVTAIKNSRFEVVATLPTTDIKTNVIYLVPKSPSQTSNVKDEYINLDGTTSGWEKIGDTEIDLSDYVTTSDLSTALADYTTTTDLTTLLAGKQNTLTFDNAPTENSDNPVKSGGVYSANQNIYEVMGKMSAKNVVPYPYQQVNSSNGITWTDNGDGTITADGTATGNSWIRFAGSTANPVEIPKSIKALVGKEVIMSSGEDISGIGIRIDFYNAQLTELYHADTSTIAERKFTIPSDSVYMAFQAFVTNGVTASNVTIYPMIRLASDSDNTYVPYVKTNKQLTDDAEALTNQANDIVNVLGAKNVLPFPYYEGSGTYNGVTITDNGDGSITLDGTCTGMSFFVFYGGRYSLAPTTFVKKNEDYIATLEVVSGSMAINSGTSKFVFRNYITNATSPFVDIFYEDNVIDTRSVKFTYEPTASYDTSLVWYEFNVGTTFNNWRIRPMIRLASITDSTYEPYAMTNQQMTPYVQAISNPNLLDNPWFTINQRGQSSYTIGTGNTTTLDRWTAFKGANGSMSVEVNNGAKITVSSDASDNAFRERIGIDEFNFLVGKTVTLSILMDGTVYSVTGKVLERAASWQTSFKRILDNGLIIELAISPSSSTTYAAEIDFRAPKDGNSYTIRAAKLELGTVSTLAMDMAPNYQQELAKCQRYFQRISQAGSSDTLCMATYRNDYTLRTVLPLTVPMRAAPSVTVNGTVSDYTNSGLTMTKISQPVTNGGAVGISFNISKSGVTWNNGVSKCITSDSTDFYIDLSADL